MEEGGALATVGIDYQKLGYQTGKMAAKILRGEAQPSELPVEGQSEYEYVVNLTAAKYGGDNIAPRIFWIKRK